MKSKSLGGLEGEKFADLFAGIGGFHLGLESLGADCVFASEWDKHAAAVYEKNFKLRPQGDITKIDENSVPEHSILCGGFPCQAFSISGKQLGFADTRGTLFFDVARIAKKKKPKVLFLENVWNFARHDGGKTLKTVLAALEEIGYEVHHQVINACELGFATARKRIYIVAFRKDLGVGKSGGFSFPAVRGKPAASVAKNLESAHPDKLWKAAQVKKKAKVSKAKAAPAFVAAARKKNPWAPIRIGTIGAGGQGNRVYSAEGPAITLSAYGGGNASKTGAYWIDGKARKLTTRECANVMGFPKGFKTDERPSQAYKQFGNSVVVGVIREIGREIGRALARASGKRI